MLMFNPALLSLSLPRSSPSPPPPCRVVLSSINVPTTLFFSELPGQLRRHPEIGKLTVISSARVPLIKFLYRSIPVDVVFASVMLLEPPNDDQLLSDTFLHTVALESRPSVNGVRTVLEIQRRIAASYDTYTCVLKAVKYWAMQRKVYGNLYTYPNGITLAIMVARITQLFSTSNSSSLLRKFFSFYAHWFRKCQPSPPIFITENIHSRGPRIPCMPPCWDPHREPYNEELIPVINPAYPYVNAAHAVGRCGLRYFLEELTRAQTVLERSPGSVPLEVLWKPFRITTHFQLFVAVHVACEASTEDDCMTAFGKWRGLVESKLRLFIYALECAVEARPFTKATPATPSLDETRRLWSQETVFAIGLRARAEASVSKRLIARSFQEMMHSIRDAERPRTGVPFSRDTKVMREPWVSYHSVHDSDFVSQLGAFLS